MGNFFKKFGQGILYLLVLPALLIVLVFFSIYGIGLFFFMLIKNIVMYFKGKSFNYKLDEDIEAERRLSYASRPQKRNDEPVVVIANPSTPEVRDAEVDEAPELLTNDDVQEIEQQSLAVEQHEDRTEEVLEIESKIDDDDDGDGDVDYSPWGGK